jgi:hypothetical protein
VSSMADRRAAVRAQLAALPEPDLRLFVDSLAVDVEAVELPLARFVAERAQAAAEPSDFMAVANRGQLLADLFGPHAADLRAADDEEPDDLPDAALPAAAACGCPRDAGRPGEPASSMIRHDRDICTDPVVARLGWYAGNADEPDDLPDAALPAAADYIRDVAAELFGRGQEPGQ